MSGDTPHPAKGPAGPLEPLLNSYRKQALRYDLGDKHKDMKTMIISSLLSGPTNATSLVDQVQILIFLLIVTLVVALFSRLLRVPYTLLLVIVGFVVGLLPFLPHEHIDPNLVLYVFIPALLFEGAWNAELGRLEADWLPIVLLTIPGMVLSLPVVAVVLHLGIGMEW